MATRLQHQEIIKIRQAWQAGVTIRELARRFRRTERTISRCVHGQSHQRVKDVEIPRLPPLPGESLAERIAARRTDQRRHEG